MKDTSEMSAAAESDSWGLLRSAAKMGCRLSASASLLFDLFLQSDYHVFGRERGSLTVGCSHTILLWMNCVANAAAEVRLLF